MSHSQSPLAEAVAIVGMAGRFPRARNLDEFWRNLRDGTECVSFFKDEDVQWLPIEHPPVADDPRYVKARAVLEKPEWFDAAFFGMNPREAAIMDPQHRVFLECAWEALEDAGCNPDTYPGLIGVFAGASMNTYLFTNLLTNPDLVKDYGLFSSMIMNDGDFVPTRVSYKLNLRGPSINVQTACSTSLVAVCLAAQSLLTYRCDAALAGGVSITFPSNRGQHHLEGGIMSNDGHCRAFDAQASGTVLGDGAGIVVLKRLSEALAEGDRIYAVIKGTGINNDGAVKIGYTAPSIDGQAECIAMAQAEAGVEPASISYVEAHGTGTPLGDPIEIAGLTKVFGARPNAPKTCAVGSVKSNIGHLDAAAGVAGLIKTVLALQHEAIPPSLHFQAANPKLELERTPFAINAALRPWPRSAQARRAGVSSFGIGGTNAHLVLEEPPAPVAAAASARPQHLLVLSAKTDAALDAATANLAAHLEAHPEQPLADVAYSLQTRRKPFAHRRAVVVDTRENAIAALRAAATPAADAAPGAKRTAARGVADSTPTVAFMFPGQGSQAVNMGRELYQSEPVFRAVVDRCSERLKPLLGLDLRDVLYPGLQGAARPDAAALLEQTRITQPALFVIEYGLAQLWLEHGVKPNAMIGHSLGEYVAACLAGVFSLEDALALVAERARLMQQQPTGAMLAVRLPEDRVREFLTDSLSLAATNARGLCVVSGPFDAITALEKKLGESDVASRRLATSHAFHSHMMEPALRPLADFIRRLERRAPQIPFVSNVTGTWITAQQATDPEYWARHVRQTVRFAEGVGQLLETGARRILLEVGPGHTLTGLARQHPSVVGCGAALVPSLPKSADEPQATLLPAIGELWAAGASIDWTRLYPGEKRRFVSLPTYPFQRTRCWIEPGITFGGWRESGAEVPRALTAAPASAPAAVVEADAADAAPETVGEGATLAALRSLFSELSGLELSGASADASFFQLGFDSLFLTQASVAVTKRVGVDVTFRELREQFTSLGKLAAHIEAKRQPEPTAATTASHAPAAANGAAQPAVAAARPAAADTGSATGASENDRLVPLTETQREIWFASQLGNEVSSAYNESSTIRLSGALDLEALKTAFRELVARHEALRTVILPSGEQQGIAASSAAELPVRDLTSLQPGTREARVREFIAAELERPFDLTKGPLFRVHVLRLDPEQHVILLVVHHIICDGWSLGILQRDLARLYSAQVCGLEGRGGASAEPRHPGELTPYGRRGARFGRPNGSVFPLRAKSAVSSGDGDAPLFSEYAARRRADRESPAYREAEDYWLRQFSDGVPTLDLPADHARPASRTYAGAFMLRTLPPDLTAQLKRLCADHDCTMYTLLLAGIAVLLHRLSGQDDLVVGVPAAAQVMDGMDDLVGHFANLLPVRSRMNGGQAFTEFLTETRRQLFGALEHWRYPFGSLLQRLNIPRDSSRMPLANVVFNSSHLRGSLSFGDLVARVEGNAKRFSHFDLNFNFAVTGDVISLGGYYSTELFDEATVARWFGHFETLLRAIAAKPGEPVGDLALLTAAEREQLLVAWNRRRLPYDREATIASLFEAQVARTPDAVAVIAEHERITYRELDARAGRLANRLRGAGVGADTLVGLFVERSADLLVAIFGILKAGGAYVPLDPKYPSDRLEFIVGDTRLPIVVTQRNLVGQLPAGGFDFLLLDDDRPEASRVGRSLTPAQRAEPNANSLAYVLYTSGSTGRPKGVAMPQRSVAALVAWAADCYERAELDGVLFSTSASFDISVFEIFCPLCLGGRIVLADNMLHVMTLPTAGEVRFLSGVPSAVAELVRLNGVPASVTTVALAGETFPQPLVDALYARPHIRRVFELYGPTETTVYSTGSLRKPNTHPTLGYPFPNEQVYILDRRLQPVPIGVQGEIYIGGDKLAREYLNRPDLTAEKFLPNPFAGSEAAGPTSSNASFSPFNRAAQPRIYRSGDLGKWCADGTIESLGRADYQVKVRGFRIELGEVEAVVAQHPGVAECAVIARADAAGHNRLLAYAVPRPGVTLGSRELRQHLEQRLPEYMVPSAVLVLDEWPRTTTGKLDRKALPDPERQGAETDYVAPGTTTEELLAEIWRDVLGLERVGVHDNFFALGGHSLLATQVIARVHDTLEVELTMRQFFAAPTVAGLAAAVEAMLITQIRTMAPAAPEPLEAAEDIS